MMVNTDYLVPMTEANQNFSKVVRTVDENGQAVILKNNKPKYIVSNLDESKTQNSSEMQMLKIIANLILTEHINAFKELAK